MTLAYRPNAAALLAFVCAALLTALIVPLIRQVALRWGIVDQPDERKRLSDPSGVARGGDVERATPELGGHHQLAARHDHPTHPTLTTKV